MTGVGPEEELDLDALLAWLAGGRVRYLRLRVGGTEVVYSSDGPPADAGPSGVTAPAPAAADAAPASDRPAPAAADGASVSGHPAPAAADGIAGAPTDVQVVAPMVGIFHHASSPGAAPYVVVGQRVATTTTVGLMESMKVFTTVLAGHDGTVVGILVPTGQAVGKGQALVRIRPDAEAGERGRP